MPHTFRAEFLVPRRHNQPGTNYIQPQAVAAGFPGDRLAQGDNAALAGRIDSFPILAHPPGVRADADDGPGLPLNHIGQDGVDAVDGAPQVDLHLFLMLGPGLFQKQAVNRPAHIVDQHIHAAESGNGLLDHCPSLGPVGYIRRDNLDPAAGVLLGYFSGYRFPLGRGQFGKGNVGALGGKGIDDSPPNVRAAAGYDNVFPLQAQFHSCHPRSWLPGKSRANSAAPALSGCRQSAGATVP